MNEQLLEVARREVERYRAEGLNEDDTFHMAVGACITFARQQRMIGEEASAETRATIEGVVKEAMHTETMMIQCPYCGQLHEPHLVEQCPLKPTSTDTSNQG
jgi:hypothetical protein